MARGDLHDARAKPGAIDLAGKLAAGLATGRLKHFSGLIAQF